MERMTMYVDILSSALEGWVNELTGSALIDDSLGRRLQMLGIHHGASAFQALAAEVAYDRALISLCAEHRIEVVTSDFAHPQADGHGSRASWLAPVSICPLSLGGGGEVRPETPGSLRF
jgi:hypothetical protein